MIKILFIAKLPTAFRFVQIIKKNICHLEYEYNIQVQLHKYYIPQHEAIAYYRHE